MTKSASSGRRILSAKHKWRRTAIPKPDTGKKNLKKRTTVKHSRKSDKETCWGTARTEKTKKKSLSNGERERERSEKDQESVKK